MRDTDIEVVMKSASVRRVEVILDEPDLEDQRADWERLSAGLAERGISASAPDPVSLERLSRVLREGGWKIDAVCEENELLALESSASGRSSECVPSGRSYGFAVGPGDHDCRPRAPGPGIWKAPRAPGFSQWPGLIRSGRDLARAKLPR